MQNGNVQAGVADSALYLRFIGDVRLPWCVTLENYCVQVLESNDVTSLIIDLSMTENLDSTTLGIVAKVGMLAKQSLCCQPVLYCTDDSVYRLLASMGFPLIFQIERTAPGSGPDYVNIALVDSDEEAIRASVIRAHKTLVGVDDDNYNKFKDLIDTLESNCNNKSG